MTCILQRMHSLVNDLLEEKKLQQNINGLASLDFFLKMFQLGIVYTFILLLF